MPETFIDFRIIKERISITALFDHYGIHLRRANQHSLRGKCPLPTHSSETSKESFSAETAKNIWACQSVSCAATRQGKRGGNIIDFVSIMESCSIRDAAIKLHGWFLSSPPAAVVPVGKTGEPAASAPAETRSGGRAVGETNKALSFTLKDVDSSHPYLLHRGIREDTATTFGVGFFPGRGSMSGRVVIPISNDRGEIVAYAGRAIDEIEPKYKLPAGFVKSATLFNLHRVLARKQEYPAGSDAVIVVEGFFDCMKVHQAGFSHVVALMGSSMSERQEELLQGFGRVVMFLDGDEAGKTATGAIAAHLMHRTFVKVISLPDEKQPDQLSSDELKCILGSF